LFLYSSSSLAGEWEPHPCNPLTSDARYARGAGRIFRVGDHLVRPAQDGSEVYGGGVLLRRILRLDSHAYDEETIARIGPDRVPGATGLHSYSRSTRFEAIDCRIAGKPCGAEA
jgi:hypothetical protein